MPQATTHHRQARQRGSAMIEMALILPVYFFLVFGVMQMCFVLLGYCNATYACRIAARFAAVHGTGSAYQCTSADIQNIVKQYLWAAPNSAVTVTTSWSPDNNPGSTVTIKVSMNYPVAIPFSSIHSIQVGTAAATWILQ